MTNDEPRAPWWAILAALGLGFGIVAMLHTLTLLVR